jgi:hypothetical protein
MSRFIQLSALTLILLGLTTSNVRADLTITLDNVTIAPGGNGSMNISVTSNDGDTLSSFGLELQIIPQGMPSALLQFSMSQADPYGNPNYVFYGQSSNASQMPVSPFWSTPSDTQYPGDTITGGDGQVNYLNNPPGYVTLGSMIGTPFTYLAAVQFFDPGGMPGETFQVSLVNDPNFTYLDDKNGNPLTIDFDHGVNGGQVTISNSVVAATPEPATMTMAIVSLGGLLGYGCSRRIARSWRSSKARIKSSLT